MEKSNWNNMLFLARRQPDVLGALEKIGVTVKHVGRSLNGERYQTSTKNGVAEDLSAVAWIKKSNGEWLIYDNKGRSGKYAMDAINAFTKLLNVPFVETVQLLAGMNCSANYSKSKDEADRSSAVSKLEANEKASPEEVKFIVPVRAKRPPTRVLSYLTKTRCIPGDLITALIKAKIIYESDIMFKKINKTYNCCVFPMRSFKDTIVGADTCSTLSYVRFKHIIPGSCVEYGWRFTYGIACIEKDTPMFFCESPIDAMSLCALIGTPGVYISMAGCRTMTFDYLSEALGGKPIICVDNDSAGDKFSAKYPSAERLKPTIGKDFNDELKFKVQNNMRYALMPN